MTSMPKPETDTLYYDGQCPICSAEIRTLIAQTDDAIEFVDLHSAEAPLPKDILESQLHLRRANGELVTGLAANVAAWQHTPKRKIAALLLMPGVKPVAELGYRLWLHWYQWQRKRRLRQ